MIAIHKQASDVSYFYHVRNNTPTLHFPWNHSWSRITIFYFIIYRIIQQRIDDVLFCLKVFILSSEADIVVFIGWSHLA